MLSTVITMSRATGETRICLYYKSIHMRQCSVQHISYSASSTNEWFRLQNGDKSCFNESCWFQIPPFSFSISCIFYLKAARDLTAHCRSRCPVRTFTIVIDSNLSSFYITPIDMSLKCLVFRVMKPPFAVTRFKARAVRQVGYQRFNN